MKKIDLDAQNSKHSGIAGLFEILLRRFKVFTQILTMLPVYILACVIIGICIAPAAHVFLYITHYFSNSIHWLNMFVIGFSVAASFFTYGLTLLFVAPAANWIMRCRLKPWRGSYYSIETIKWFIHNGLTYIARFTFLDFVTPTPLANLFYQMMGMQIGRGTVINTTYISDPSLISMGEKVTIGGSVTIVGHYGQGGLLIIAPVKIGNGCTIGLKCSIMGGVTIGDNAKVMPHSVVMPKTTILENETWGGVPARKIELQESSQEDNKKSS